MSGHCCRHPSPSKASRSSGQILTLWVFVVDLPGWLFPFGRRNFRLSSSTETHPQPSKCSRPFLSNCCRSLIFVATEQCFLPQSAVHDAKKKKMVNCGVVAFTLERCA